MDTNNQYQDMSQECYLDEDLLEQLYQESDLGRSKSDFIKLQNQMFMVQKFNDREQHDKELKMALALSLISVKNNETFQMPKRSKMAPQ